MIPEIDNQKNIDSKNKPDFSEVMEQIMENAKKQLFTTSYEKDKKEIITESENFMNELYEMAKSFTPTDDVYFNIEEKDGIIQKIEFRDLRKEPSGKRPAQKRKFLAGIKFERSPDGSSFGLSTYGPTIYYNSFGELKSYDPSDRSSSNTGYSHNLRDLSKQIQRKIETVNNKRQTQNK